MNLSTRHDEPLLFTWYGRPNYLMSRADLLAVIQHLISKQVELHFQHQRDLEKLAPQDRPS